MKPSKIKNRYQAVIGQREYTIIGEASIQHMRLVAETVDQQMATIAELSPFLDTTRIAVLTAVNATSDLIELQIESDKKKEKIIALEREILLLKQEIKGNQSSY